MSPMPTRLQVSAGGVAFRRRDDRVEVALISVGEQERWQLPKGMVGKDETPEAAALREVREETGLETELIAPIDQVEYWYVGSGRGGRIRFHKFVHFYLLRYLSGDTQDHDQEVNEARWVEIGWALDLLAFDNEKEMVRRARDLIGTLE